MSDTPKNMTPGSIDDFTSTFIYRQDTNFKFTTPIELKGNWQVAVTSVIYPSKLKPIKKSIKVKLEGEEEVKEISFYEEDEPSKTIYNLNKAFLDAWANKYESHLMPAFSLNAGYAGISLELTWSEAGTPEPKRFVFTALNRFLQDLGFNLVELNEWIKTAKRHSSLTIGKKPMRYDKPSAIIVTSNFTKGILAALPISSKGTEFIQFQNLHWADVKGNELSNFYFKLQDTRSNELKLMSGDAVLNCKFRKVYKPEFVEPNPVESVIKQLEESTYTRSDDNDE